MIIFSEIQFSFNVFCLACKLHIITIASTYVRTYVHILIVGGTVYVVLLIYLEIGAAAAAVSA